MWAGKKAVEIIAQRGQNKRLLRAYDANSWLEYPFFVSLSYEIGDLIATAANIAHDANAYHAEKEAWAKEWAEWNNRFTQGFKENGYQVFENPMFPEYKGSDSPLAEMSFAIFVNLVEDLPAENLHIFARLESGPFIDFFNPWIRGSGVDVSIRPGEINGDIEFAFSSLYDAILYDAYEMYVHRISPVTCQNCGKLFFPHSRSDETYCDHIFKNGKTCKDLGYEMKIQSDKVLKEYRRIYKTQNARKQRNSHIQNISDRFDKWKLFAKSRLKACQSGEITLSDLIDEISGSEWISGSI